MILATGFHEAMMLLGFMAIVVLCAFVVAWLCYCISSIARAADALERIADALEDEDEDEGGAA